MARRRPRSRWPALSVGRGEGAAYPTARRGKGRSASEEAPSPPRRNLAVIQQASSESDDSEHEGRAAAPTAERFDIDLSARWFSAWPSEPVALEARVVTFFWPRHECFYAATTCEAHTRENGCYYRCDVGQTKVASCWGPSREVPSGSWSPGWS